MNSAPGNGWTGTVLTLANDQHGVVGRRQLIALGIGPGFIDARIAASSLNPVYPGVYAVGHSRLTVRGHWMAAVLAAGECAALSHRSAAANWNLVPTPHFVEVIRSSSPDESAPAYAGRPSPFGKTLTIHRSRHFNADEYEIRNGIRTTTVARTFLDLASVLSVDQLDSALAEVERQGIVHFEDLRRMARRGRGWTGVGKLRQAIDEWDPTSTGTKSALELAFFRLCRQFGIPPPDVNVIVQ